MDMTTTNDDTLAVEIAAAKERIAQEARALHPRLIDISQDLHAHPELSFQEQRAAQVLTNELEEHGFEVERGVAGMDTAFIATYGSGEPVVAILAEYDALPKIGHACGHNLIAVWGVGGGIALKRALPDSGGTIKVIGCPAEEGGGGKVIMANAGIFNGLSAAMMMHPRDTTYIDRGSLAIVGFDVEFAGKAAHASSSPEQGINALDALLQVFFSVAQLRQQFPPQTRIHGVITHGGDAANVIPDYTRAEFLVRANDQAYHEKLKQLFRDICNAARAGDRLHPHPHRGARLQAAQEQPGADRALPRQSAGDGAGLRNAERQHRRRSSDIGDVSQLVPTIHPYLQIADKGTPGHTLAFAEAAASARADDLTATGATLLAWTAADVLLNPAVRDELRSTFIEQMGHEPAS